MKNKLLLINPDDFTLDFSALSLVGHLTKKPGRFMNAALPTIAALTPEEYFDVEIIDERIETIDFEKPYDLVGITGYLTQIMRAEDLANEFSKRGIPVVCGGSGVSVNPERWRHFADVLIIGEAERIWPQFLKDFISGSYRSEYREDEKIDLSITPVSDYSSIPDATMKKFVGGVVQTSRGCPYNCEYCDAIVYVGRKIRYKMISCIIEEIDMIYKRGLHYVFLGDDNFSANRNKAKEILKAIREWNRPNKHPMSFTAASSIDVANDEEFLELAAEAGINRIYVGIETPNKASLKEANKFINIRSNMTEDIKKFQLHGIQVFGGCMVGFDNDDLSIFQNQFDFFMQVGIPFVFVFPLQAPDGTPLKERMIKEGRYIDWQKECTVNRKQANNFNTFSFIPKQMTINQLQQGTYWLIWQLYKPENFAERLRQFFENFESSPKKEKLAIPSGVDLGELGILWRILKYIFTKAHKWERKLFWNLVRLARGSSHPRKWEFAISGFLTVISTRGMLIRQEPQIMQVTYPQ